MAYVSLGSKAVGSIVKLRENGVIAEYIVVQQGQPHPMYDASCNGTWLLRKDILEMRQWHPVGDNRYASSEIHAYLNNTFAARFDAAIFGAIKQVKIPYAAGYQSGAVYSGANGLTTRAFLLGGTETGLPTDGNFFNYLLSDGAKLAYFDYGASAQPKRQANYNGQLTEWYLRSPSNQNTKYVFSIEKYGLNDLRCPMTTNPLGIRPALIMSSAVYTLDDGTIVTNQPPGVPASISYPANISGGTTITVSWGAASDADGNLAGYIVEKSIDGGSSWAQIYQGGAYATNDAVAFGISSVIYRVKAYDALGLHSGYRTGTQVTVINNRAPGAPASINVPLTVEGGKNITVTWGAASDADGNLSGYALERSVNGGTFAEIYRGNALSNLHTITKGWNTVTYRVRAYDAYTVYSGYTTSTVRNVINNTPPNIACTPASGSDLGTKSAGFTVSYTVTDAEGDAVSVTEAIDGVAKRTYTATLGASNSFAVTGEYFQKLLNGARTMTVTAGDGRVNTVHTLKFTKSVTAASVTLTAPMDADAQITLAALAVTGSIPGDADYLVEITNNAKDAAPVWEDCTAAVRAGANHVFTNQSAANGFAFNFRLTVSRGASGVGGHITSIQGGFQ